MKKILSFLLVVAMITALLVPTALAAESYDGKTVIVYSGNLRGDVDAYAKLAAAKADFASKGAAVYLVDAGNYLQGTTYANSDRGESIYNLMDKAGYDVAAMGAYEFAYGDATTGFIYHSNFFKYHTQAQLYKGAASETYKQNGAGTVTATLGEKAPAEFAVISSNLSGEGSYYAFDANKVLGNVGFVALTDENVADMLQDGFLDGYAFGEAAVPECDILICLSNNGETVEGADLTIYAPTDGETVMGAYVIDNASKTVSEAALPELSDAAVASAAAEVKAAAKTVLGTSDVMLNGADRDNWCKETNLGDLTADALLWYANNKFEGFEKDVPVVAIQNGGNCDQFLYTGDITETELLRSLPFSPMGVGILYVTGAQLLETLEAATSPSEAYGEDICPGFAQVAGLTYNVDSGKEYDAGAAYGKFYEADSVNRVTITSVNGQVFDENATYAVIADNYLMNGNDTYYVFKAAKAAEGAKYINNGNGIKTRDIVAMYIKEALNGTVGEEYAAPQGRITAHSYTAVVIAPTCTEKGYTEYTCNCGCGDSYKDTYTDALGHNYKDGICAVCGAKDANYIATPTLKITTSAGHPKLSWSAVDGATKYWIYRSTDGVNFKYYDMTTKTSYTNSSTSVGTTYYYKVKAVKVADNTNVTSDFSVAKSILCKPAAPSISIYKASGKPQLKWSAVNGATKYWIYRSTDGVNFKYYDMTTKTSYTNTSTAIGTTYYYKVKAVMSVNGKDVASAYSNEKALLVSTAAPTVKITTSNGNPRLSWNAVDGATKYWVYRSTDGKNFSYYYSTTYKSFTNTSAKAGTTYYYKVVAVKAVDGTNISSAYSNIVSVKAK